MNGGVGAEFGMEGSGEEIFFLDERGFARIFSEDVDAGADALNDGSADEDHFHRFILEFGRAKENVAGELAAVGVAKDGHVEKAERSLRGIFDFCSEENGSGAGAEDGAAGAGEIANRVEEAFFLEELQLRGAFAAGEDEAIALSELRGRAHFDGFGAELMKHGGVGGEVALDGEDADFQANHPSALR